MMFGVKANVGSNPTVTASGRGPCSPEISGMQGPHSYSRDAPWTHGAASHTGISRSGPIRFITSVEFSRCTPGSPLSTVS